MAAAKIILRPEPYDPDAVDADGDGIVQERTPWERPAGTRLLDASGAAIEKGRSLTERPAGLRVVDKNNREVAYTPSYAGGAEAPSGASSPLSDHGALSLREMGLPSVRMLAAPPVQPTPSAEEIRSGEVRSELQRLVSGIRLPGRNKLEKLSKKDRAEYTKMEAALAKVLENVDEPHERTLVTTVALNSLYWASTALNLDGGLLNALNTMWGGASDTGDNPHQILEDLYQMGGFVAVAYPMHALKERYELTRKQMEFVAAGAKKWFEDKKLRAGEFSEDIKKKLSGAMARVRNFRSKEDSKTVNTVDDVAEILDNVDPLPNDLIAPAPDAPQGDWEDFDEEPPVRLMRPPEEFRFLPGGQDVALPEEAFFGTSEFWGALSNLIDSDDDQTAVREMMAAFREQRYADAVNAVQEIYGPQLEDEYGPVEVTLADVTSLVNNMREEAQRPYRRDGKDSIILWRAGSIDPESASPVSFADSKEVAEEYGYDVFAYRVPVNAIDAEAGKYGRISGELLINQSMVQRLTDDELAKMEQDKQANNELAKILNPVNDRVNRALGSIKYDAMDNPRSAAAEKHLHEDGGAIEEVPDTVLIESILDEEMVDQNGDPVNISDVLYNVDNYALDNYTQAGRFDPTYTDVTIENRRFRMELIKSSDPWDYGLWAVWKTTDKQTGKEYFLKASQYGVHDAILERVSDDVVASVGFPSNPDFRGAHIQLEGAGAAGGLRDGAMVRWTLVPHIHDSLTDASPGWQGTPVEYADRRSVLATEAGPMFHEDVGRMAAMDYVLNNTDRHEGNLMVYRDTEGEWRLLPIDHGMTFAGRASEMDDAQLGTEDEIIETIDSFAQVYEQDDTARYSIGAGNTMRFLFDNPNIVLSAAVRRIARPKPQVDSGIALDGVRQALERLEQIDADELFSPRRLGQVANLTPSEIHHLDIAKAEFIRRRIQLRRNLEQSPERVQALWNGE